MYELGKYNRLKIARDVDFGVFVSDDEGNEILLPLKQVPNDAQIGDTLDLFVYNDSEDRPIATTNRPAGCSGDIVALEVVDVNPSIGVFLNWGLQKDLLLPFKHQKRNKKLRIGNSVLVKILHDAVSNRLIATTRIMSLYEPSSGQLKHGDAVSLQIAEPHECGFIVLIDNLYQGMLFASDLFEQLNIGDCRNGYIKNIRTDGKIDVTLKPIGIKAIQDDKQIVLAKIAETVDGYLPFNSKSSAEELQKEFFLSKKAFKKAIGGLYKERKIIITDDGIELVNKKNRSCSS